MSSNTELIVSAPGKVILHGEHAVVYGKKALAAAINLRTYLKMTPNSNNKVTVRLLDICISREWQVMDIEEAVSNTPVPATFEETVEKLKRFAGVDESISDTQQLAVVAFLYLYTGIAAKSLPPLDVVIRSHLSPGAGLGSSAAFSTCLAASLLLHTQHVANEGGSWSDPKLINHWAFQAEKVIHGKPSGIDNSVSTFGGAVVLQNGQLSFLDTIPQLRILLVNTKVPRSTKVLVAGVRDKYNLYTGIIAPILDAVEAISDSSIETYSKMTPESATTSYNTIKDLVEMNQTLLELLGVSHPAIETVIQVAKRCGLFSKLTGAGGGGCVFAIVPPSVNEKAVIDLTREVEKLGYDCWETSIGAVGVSRHFVADSTIEALFTQS